MEKQRCCISLNFLSHRTQWTEINCCYCISFISFTLYLFYCFFFFLLLLSLGRQTLQKVHIIHTCNLKILHSYENQKMNKILLALFHDLSPATETVLLRITFILSLFVVNFQISLKSFMQQIIKFHSMEFFKQLVSVSIVTIHNVYGLFLNSF